MSKARRQTPDSFANFGKSKAKEASNICLIPTIRDPTASVSFATLCDVLCQGLSNGPEVAAEMLTLA